MLTPKEKQFTVPVDTIGTFTFKYPTLKDELESDAISSKLLAGNESPSIAAANIATMMGALSLAIVEGPEAFDLDNVYSYDELETVFSAFNEKVSAFRKKATVTKKQEDQGASTDGCQDA